MTAALHGAPLPTTPDLLLTADPDLWLVCANLTVWLAAQSCRCEALCVCDKADA